jgi:ADP-heptose:LPS heptosyltransferase
MKKSIKNILVVRSDRFGEFLLNIPAIRALKENFPETKITLAVSAEVKELAGTIEQADEVEIWGEDFRKSLRQRKFDICVVMNPAKEAHLAAFLAGIPVRVGYNRKWGFLLTKKIADNKALGLKHEVESNLELVSLIGAKTIDKSISLEKLPEYSNPEYRGAIAVHPFTSDLVKQWPLERFMELAERIAQEFKSKVVLVGRAGDAVTVPFGVIDLINRTSLVELAQILKQCRLLVTCDSGPMHLAEAVGTPVVALFRNDLPGKTAARWGPRLAHSIVIENNNLPNILVDEVFGRVKEVLKK